LITNGRTACLSLTSKESGKAKENHGDKVMLFSVGLLAMFYAVSYQMQHPSENNIQFPSGITPVVSFFIYPYPSISLYLPPYNPDIWESRFRQLDSKFRT
jgi:hypothetical protein